VQSTLDLAWVIGGRGGDWCRSLLTDGGGDLARAENGHRTVGGQEPSHESDPEDQVAGGLLVAVGLEVGDSDPRSSGPVFGVHLTDRRLPGRNVARFGRIDRSGREVTSRLNASLYACHHHLANPELNARYRCKLLTPVSLKA
jgi:hypothetical protein